MTSTKARSHGRPRFSLAKISLLFLGPVLLYSAPVDRDQQRAFPVQFEQSGSEWIARGPGYQLIVDPTGATLGLSHINGHQESLRMAIVGAKATSAPQAELPSSGYRNYLIGSDRARWRKNVHLWSRVRIPEVLPVSTWSFTGRDHASNMILS